MDNLIKQDLKNKLRNRMSRFVGCQSQWCNPLNSFLDRIRENSHSSFLCGGAIRDILLSSVSARIIPRDLDIIIAYTDIEEFTKAFSDSKTTWNCYGGVSIERQDWTIDVWQLNKTWAFQQKLVELNGFSDFPKTTFLDIEAIAVELFCSRGRKRKIYSSGFFEAILNRTIEINLEENPNPKTCIIRALRIASKLQFALGPKLARYIDYHVRKIELDDLFISYKSRYNPKYSSIDSFRLLKNTIRTQLQTSPNQPIRLPNINGRCYGFETIKIDKSLHQSNCLF